MSDNYTPDEYAAKQMYVLQRQSMHNHISPDYGTEFDRFIAKVKADALREAGQRMRAQVERATEYQRFTEHELIEHGIEHVLNEYADRIEGEE